MTQLTIEQAMEMATAQLNGGRANEAIAVLRQILSIQPDHRGALLNLGIALHGLGRVDDSLNTFEQAIRIDPAWPEGWNNLGVILRQLGRADEAIGAFKKALEHRPDYPYALSNLGNTLQEVGRPEEAIPLHEQAIALLPDFVTAHCNLANALKFSGRIEDAISAYRRAMTLAPDDAAIHHYLGLTLLLNAEFDEGFTEHEWRCAIKQPRPICWDFPQPRWDGRDLQGRSLLLHAEQGFGDTIQFVRYVSLIATEGGKIILQCQPELVRLLRQLEGVSQLIPQGGPLPGFDLHCPLMSLPLIFKTTVGTIPAPIPYLRADAKLAQRWRDRIESPGHAQEPLRRGLKIGLVWAGQRQYSDDRNRSLTLAMLAPLAAIRDLRFFSLQKGDAAADLAHPPAGLKLIDWTPELIDFAETAALIDNLDLVITVDTAVAHLAGAMGKQVFVLLPFVPDWRWMMDRGDSPWYPTVRLLRQPRTGDWDRVVENLVQLLHNLIRARA